MNVDSAKQLPTVLSLCSGYGGIERGLELAGFEHRTVVYVEIEAFAVANLVAKMETGQMVPAPVWTDLKTLPAHCFRDRIDVITGGHPCQPFSAAGLRKGAEDPRHLWPHIKRHIETIRPVRVFLENVEGHISLGLREVIADLESLGYATMWGIFSATEVGAPHQRKRVYILAHANNAGRGGEAVADTGSESGRGGTIYPRARNQGREASAARGEGVSPGDGQALANHTQSGGEDVPNAIGEGLERHAWNGIQSDQQGRQHSQPNRPTGEIDLQQRQRTVSWPTEPNVGRVVNGSAFRVDRLRLLGNGVVPQTAAKAWRILSEQLMSEQEQGK